MSQGWVLLGDLNGQDLVLALARPGEAPVSHEVVACNSIIELRGALERKLDGFKHDELIGAAISAAGPLINGSIEITTTGLHTSQRWLREVLQTPRVHLLNDLAAVALGAGRVSESQLKRLRSAESDQTAAIAVIGLGLGLGVAGLVPDGGGNWISAPSEAGHTDFCSCGPREKAIFDAVRIQRGDTAAERLLSRGGLSDIYSVLRDGMDALGDDVADDVLQRAAGGDRHAVEAISIFSGMLGAFAGDIALMFAARGGVYLNSRLLTAMGLYFDQVAFEKRFTAKGRMSAYVSRIPVMLIAGRPVLLGLSSLFTPNDRRYGATDVAFLDC
ncbi:glucokinase [soil metagenome]